MEKVALRRVSRLNIGKLIFLHFVVELYYVYLNVMSPKPII